MKRAFFLIPLIALSLPLAQAAPKASPKPAKPVATKAEKAEAAPAADTKPADAKPADTAKGDAQPGDAAAKPEKGEEVKDGKVEADGQNAKAVDATRRLRDKLATVDTELAALSKPSRSLVQRCKSRKESITNQLERLDKVAMEVAALQERFNKANSKEFEFTIVIGDDRDKYVRDGKAAHKAMLVDMKETKIKRKIGGLDKYEIMRDRYQGMPEFKEASEWYNRTIDDLEKSWTKMQTNEKARREKLNSAKKDRMKEDDDREFNKLEQQLKAAGEDIAKVWYRPTPRNLRMLSNCLNKVHDVQRRRNSSSNDKNDNIGCVPPLLTQFWEAMDQARALLLKGDLESAQSVLERDPSFNRIVRLNRNVMPDEYKEPLKEQRKALLSEIKLRSGENTRTQKDLERKISELERTGSNIEARIDALLEDIERERGIDAGENTATINDAELDTKPEKEKAQAGAETPAAESESK